MTPLVTQFTPPAGLHAHEVPFLMGEGDDEEWFQRALAAAYLEMADNGTITYTPAPGAYPTRHEVPGVVLTAYQEKIAGMMTGTGRRFENLLSWKKLVWIRLAEDGLVDPENGRPTQKGMEMRREMAGYREYLRQAMTDRLHAEAVIGNVDRDVEFAVAMGIISLPNAYRAVSTRLGVPPTGMTGGLFDMLGGKATEQHAYSQKRGRLPKACMFLFFAWIVGFMALFAWAWNNQNR